ncbi:PREDICTED: putative pentatricopeptide repeat-containing protein At1g12700, mitochondrial [Populus euphratica]|uniref:Pentatricopeptide repeat-containing protein At1g12700, mitochondrial n=1 Tax=Populus euphratica TaxID=75702 RepID=A0AAJ6Y027_POPEU|nr:PREDICTED: putative pentatricopeptide repeat-containing protein At1g12700, mitochondrial [Populus euphratica]
MPSMKPRSMTKNCVTNNVQNRLREEAGRVLEAKELFKDIRAQSHFPDLMTYSTLLDGLRKQGSRNLKDVLELFSELSQMAAA